VARVPGSCAEQPAIGRLFAFYGVDRERGFTLLELMVVLVIVGIVLTYAVLSVSGQSRDEQLRREGQRLAALIEMASDEAVLRSEQIAVRFEEDGYEFMTLQGNKWLALSEDPMFAARTLPEGIELQLELEDNPPPQLVSEESDLPQVFLLSSGEMTPFLVMLSAPQAEHEVAIKADILGRLELE
jgi:general secretion pathway protein H